VGKNILNTHHPSLHPSLPPSLPTSASIASRFAYLTPSI